jgi:phosphohistidine phosphatase
MLRLLLLRHAKAVPFKGSGDHERSLTERGRADAAQMGAFVNDQNFAVQAAIHSGARRTRETLAIVVGKLHANITVSVEPRLYEATSAEFLRIVQKNADETANLLLVGHNPSIAETACRLAASGNRRALAKMSLKFPTSALAVIDFDTEHWSAAREGAGRLIHFVTPAELGAAEE